jgi:hypothetical protein
MSVLERLPWIRERRRWADGRRIAERISGRVQLPELGLAERLDRVRLPDVSRIGKRLPDVLSIRKRLPEIPLPRRRRRGIDVKTVVIAGLAGAVLAYLLDPQSGKRRRTTGRDRLLGALRAGGRRLGRARRHAASDAYGLGQRVLHPRSGQDAYLDDATLAHKVESELFRNADIPKGSINVNVEHGVVVLRGEVDRPEQIAELTEGARQIPGVRGVESLLHVAGGPYSGD